MSQLPVPDFFDANRVDRVWRVPYQQRAAEAEAWAQQHHITPAASDRHRVGLLAIDVQNTFCLPDFELFVAGRSGRGAVDDNRRLCEFIYRHLGVITDIVVTLDTHTATQIFHAVFWVDDAGHHPPASTLIHLEDVQQRVWKPNPAVAASVTLSEQALEDYALHYVRRLTEDGRYPLTIWPYHAILGGISHALVAAVEEAVFFHNIARNSQTQFEQKGSNPLTENYSALQPEVLVGTDGRAIAHKNTALIDRLLAYDVLIVAGQAKSHCVAWTVEDLLTEIKSRDPKLAHQVYLLEDCSSPVVIGEAVDFTAQADAAFERFAHAGINIVRSSTAIADWF
ncbi:MAG: isochorismatase [Cyanophyceae cyanobacterium]